MEAVLVDTCVFIDILRGNREYFSLLGTLNVVISPIVHMELLQRARNVKEVKRIDDYLSASRFSMRVECYEKRI